MYYLIVNVVKYLIGTAWLSSVRVVECYIYLLNGRNLSCKNQINFLLKILLYTLKVAGMTSSKLFLRVRCLMKLYFIYEKLQRIILKITRYNLDILSNSKNV